MADPLSISASIAGLISLSYAVFRYLYKYRRAATGGKEKIQSLATEINGLSGILRSLEALTSELETEGQAYDANLRVHHISHCRQILEKIEKRVKKAVDSFSK
ncbi:Fc.00g084420.m01.CDS01 [Cosmosporella sp. VM-42]